MTDQKSPSHSFPRIESIRIKNLRALCDLESKPLAPLSALLGASSSGESHLF
jgi:AAA15 family ATPase/GTPase